MRLASLSGTLNPKLLQSGYSSTTSDSGSEQLLHFALHSTSTVVFSVDQLLSRYWVIEDFFGAGSKSISRLESDHVRTSSLRSPLNSNEPPIGETFNQANHRFLPLERQLQSTGLTQNFTDYFNGYKDAGDMSISINHIIKFSKNKVMKGGSFKIWVNFDGSAASSSGWFLSLTFDWLYLSR